MLAQDATPQEPRPQGRGLRETVMSIILAANISSQLRGRKQWVLWRYQTRKEDPTAKPTKVPIQATGYPASVTNPNHWSSFDHVYNVWRRQIVQCDGIGYVFNEDDPFTGVDLDALWQSDADEGAQWALRILERFGDTYSEVSPSDHGVKIWCRAKAPRCGRWPIGTGAIEIYDRVRFFTVTGRSAGVTDVTDHQVDIELLVSNLDAPEEGRTRTYTPISDIIPQGQRHTTLVSLAGTMWKRGLTLEAIEAALQITDQKQCNPPHGPEHIRKIVASMTRWAR
jgi:hypothetical protein